MRRVMWIVWLAGGIAACDGSPVTPSPTPGPFKNALVFVPVDSRSNVSCCYCPPNSPTWRWRPPVTCTPSQRLETREMSIDTREGEIEGETVQLD